MNDLETRQMAYAKAVTDNAIAMASTKARLYEIKVIRQRRDIISRRATGGYMIFSTLNAFLQIGTESEVGFIIAGIVCLGASLVFQELETRCWVENICDNY